MAAVAHFNWYYN